MVKGGKGLPGLAVASVGELAPPAAEAFRGKAPPLLCEGTLLLCASAHPPPLLEGNAADFCGVRAVCGVDAF